MDSIVKELINIEKSADAVLDATINDRKTLPQRITDEIAIRVKAIDEETGETINRLYASAKEESLNKIKKIQEGLVQKTTALENVFIENKEAWKRRIFQNIIYGGQ